MQMIRSELEKPDLAAIWLYHAAIFASHSVLVLHERNGPSNVYVPQCKTQNSGLQALPQTRLKDNLHRAAHVQSCVKSPRPAQKIFATPHPFS